MASNSKKPGNETKASIDIEDLDPRTKEELELLREIEQSQIDDYDKKADQHSKLAKRFVSIQ